jgi:photosystem II stability/assembly factor-like uncharacterized protein
MNFSIGLVITLGLLSCLAACDVRRSEPMSGSGPVKSNPVVLRPLHTALIEGGEQVVDAVESKIGSGERFQTAQFVDAQNGWASTNKSLYHTSDGGNTWEGLALNLPSDSTISSFFFINEAVGWLTVVNRSFVEPRYGLGNSSRILTSNDGGRSWIEQASFPDEVDLGCVRFLNANEGVATGARVIDAQPPYSEIFAIRTSDGGKSWKNISEKVGQAIKSEYGLAYDYAHRIDWSSSSRLLLLTRLGKVISSTDQGETWKTIAHFKDERPEGFISSTGYYKLVLNPLGMINVIAGAEGDEGFWGDFVTKDDQDSWVSYELIRIPIRDAVFLSETEVIACGLEIQAYEEKTKTRKPSMGILLHSTDSGKTWSAIHRSQSNEGFISLSKVTKQQFYAVGEGGAFVRFILRNR